MALQQSPLYQTFLKITDVTISEQTMDELTQYLSSIVSMFNPSSTNKKTLHGFIQRGYLIQLLQYLFSKYSIITKCKRSTFIFDLILCAQIPPHVIIDCLITLWQHFVSPHIDTEQPSFSIQKGDFSIIANDIIHLMKKLLSKQSNLMILLACWGTKIHDNKSMDLHKFVIDPQCEENIRSIVSIHDLFAPYFYLYRDFFRSLNNTNAVNAQSSDSLFVNYQFFQRKSFIKYLIQNSMTIIVQYTLNNFECKQNDNKAINALNNNKHLRNLCKGIALFYSVLSRVGFVATLNRLMLCDVKQHNNKMILLLYSLLIESIAKLPGFNKWFESFLLTISNDEYHNISCVENIKFMFHLLQRILKNEAYHSEIEYLLSHKFVINKQLSLHTLDYIISLLNYLNVDDDFVSDIKDEDSDDGYHSIMIETINEIGNIWSTKTCTLKQNYNTQQYLTRALVLLIEFIIQRLKSLNKLEEAARLIPFLFKGVQSRFSSDIVETRHLGMIVAQQYSKIYPNTEALQFGVDLSNIFKIKNAKYQCCNLNDDVKNIIKNTKIDYSFNHILCDEQKVENTVTEMKNDGDDNINTHIKYTNNEAAVDASWLDEMRKCDMNSDDDANIWSSNSDSDDANGLEAHSLSDDEEDLRKVPLPSYIRDCWNLINAKQKPDETESGLIAATNLIRNNPFDLKDCAIGLCQTLLHLQNEFCITNFAVYKRNALVSLIVVCTEPILDYLPFQLYTKQWSVGVKLEILTVLVDAARELGHLSSLHINDTNDTRKAIKDDKTQSDLSIISQNQSHSEKERWKIIDARVAMKTKRWASKPKHIALKENKFAKYATRFVYPLLNGYHENEAYLMDFSALNTRILFALGCCVECSGIYGVHTLEISKDIFELILSLYHDHKLPEVRRSSVFVLSRILLHVSSSVLKEQTWFVSELNTLVHNLMDITSNDNDFATRDLSKLCLRQLKQIFE